jgi:GT2 family glycosyltransferase
LTNFSGSIVLFKNESLMLAKAVSSYLNATGTGVLYLIDNSPTDVLKSFGEQDRVRYIHNPSNPGFGAAHNIAIKLALDEGYKYHFIINPDIYFTGDIITPMIQYMDTNSDVGMLMPEVLNEDGSVQYLPKLLPTPIWIFRRKLKIPRNLHTKFASKYELRDVPRKIVYNAPLLSGCFSLLRLLAIEEVGAYDDRYFMYFEDFDLSRRLHKKYKTIYFPGVSVYHSYDSGANKSFKLFRIFLNSMVVYFNKWGWCFDSERKIMNENTTSQFNL